MSARESWTSSHLEGMGGCPGLALWTGRRGIGLARLRPAAADYEKWLTAPVSRETRTQNVPLDSRELQREPVRTLRPGYGNTRAEQIYLVHTDRGTCSQGSDHEPPVWWPAQRNRVNQCSFRRETDVLGGKGLGFCVVERAPEHPGGTFARDRPWSCAVDRFAVGLKASSPISSRICCACSGIVPSGAGQYSEAGSRSC